MKRDNIPALLQTPIEEIDAVIDDLELEQAGCKIHYCVDAAEIVEFCFPLNPFLPKEIDLSMVASDQAALYELFYKRPEPPILLPHYVPELVSHFNFVRNNTEKNIEAIGMVERFIEGAPLERDLEENLENIEKHFDVKLAVWMGIGSIGAQRLQEILSKRLHKINDIEAPFIRDFLRTYKPMIAQSIYQEQERSIRELLKDDTKKVEQRLKALSVDAAAIDWLLQLNKTAVQTTHQSAQGIKVPAHVFLYVSSAPKTRRIFKLPQVREMRPHLAVPATDSGRARTPSSNRAANRVRPFWIWRTRRQLSLMVTAARNASDPKEIINNLYEIRSVASEAQRITVDLSDQANDCENCILKGGQSKPECQSLSVCQSLLDLQSSINERMEPVENLGLLARIQAYKQLLGGKPQRHDQKAYRDYLEMIMKREDVPALAVLRINDLQMLARVETVMARRTMEGIGLSIHEEIQTKAEDAHLPTSKPWLAEEFPSLAPPYNTLAQAVFEYHRSAHLTPPAARETLLDSAMTKFHKLEKETSFPAGADHELARCLIYFSFGGTKGEQDALRHSIRMVRRYPERTRDFLRAGCFAAQELGRFQDVHNAASRGIEVEPSDWFFHHARSVNTFEWWQNVKMRDYCPMPLLSCLRDMDEAAALLPDTHPGLVRVKALINNNLAYFNSFDSEPPFDKLFNLDAARRALELLERVFPETYWGVKSPDKGGKTFAAYFHTKAHVFFRCWQAGHNQPKTTELLTDALRCIEAAIALKDVPFYKDLKRDIEKALKVQRATQLI